MSISSIRPHFPFRQEHSSKITGQKLCLRPGTHSILKTSLYPFNFSEAGKGLYPGKKIDREVRL
ncbi:hypothetical protein LR013_05570 [candidate division NPL-UPA2 bacterium]|nr:hypothetical protein [candidate division NPL-UPA2 bacterium]